MEGNFMKGFTIAILMSIPLWISIIGWVKILSHFLSVVQATTF